jgi:hypothetical protein
MSMREGLGLKNSEAVLIDWGRRNPSLARHLQEFVLAKFDLIRTQKSFQASRPAPAGKPSNQDADRSIERTCYETIRRVLLLACKIDPSLDGTRKLMAETEERLGNFESAYHLFSELIAELRSHGDHHDRNSLIDLITQRGRIVLQWSKELRRANSPTAEKRVLELLTHTTAALKECETDVSDLADRTGLLHGDLEAVYNYYWISSEAHLAKGEIERKAGQHQAFRAAKRSFDLLDAFAREHNCSNPKEFENLRSRVLAGVRLASAATAQPVGTLGHSTAPANLRDAAGRP